MRRLVLPREYCSYRESARVINCLSAFLSCCVIARIEKACVWSNACLPLRPAAYVVVPFLNHHVMSRALLPCLLRKYCSSRESPRVSERRRNGRMLSCRVLQYDAVRYEFILLVLNFAEGCLFYRALLQNIVSFVGLFEEERGGSFSQQ